MSAQAPAVTAAAASAAAAAPAAADAAPGPGAEASTASSGVVRDIDVYLKNTSEAIQDAIRSQASRISIESVTSEMSAFSTTSARHKEWEASIRMDVLQFRVMARVLEHINKWSTSTLFWAAADQLQTGKDSQPVDPRHLKAQLKRDVEVIWGGAQSAQLKFIRHLYDAMLKLLNLGDWELGYRRLVEREDGLSALLSMCGASGKVAPALPWAALLTAIQNSDGTMNYTRLAHVLSRLAVKVKKVKEASRKTYDALFWLLADQLASQEGASGVPGVSHPPTPVQQQQLLTCLCQLVTFSQSQMLSQLLLQLLLISCCMPSLEDLRQGTKQSLHFVSSLVRACTEASLEAPGELIFADVQICLVLACVMMTATPPHVVLQAALDAGLLDLQHKALNATSVRPVQLDMDVLRLVRAREHSAIIGRLLSCAQRELNSLMGMVKLVLTVICGHEDPAARKATILQLSPPALAHTCLVLHPFMSNPSKALSGGTSQEELDVVGRVAKDLAPQSLEWVIKLIRAGCLHMVAQWQAFLNPVLELSKKPAMMQALQFGCIGNAPSTNAYAIMFLAGNVKEYRSLARSWPRIHRIIADVCEEACSMTKMCPQVASPLRGSLAQFLTLDVELGRNLPYSAALQHLAQCITQPDWLSVADRSSALEAAPKEPRRSFHRASIAIQQQADDGSAAAANMRRGLLDRDLVNKQRMDTIAFSIGGALFHAVALSCEQNSPIMKAKLSKMSNIYKQVIPMRIVGNLDNTSMYEAFTLACEFMYTGAIEALEDAEVAVNVWMVGVSLAIHGLATYCHTRFLEVLPTSHMHILPGVFRQARAARTLSKGQASDSEEQGSSILQATLEFFLCKLQLLVKKRVIYRILAEHGDTFSDCLAAAVGEMLDMPAEISQNTDDFDLFKFQEEKAGSPDFWRQLAAGAVLRRGVRAWLRRQRAKAAQNKVATVLGALAKGPSVEMAPPQSPRGIVGEHDREDSLLLKQAVSGGFYETKRETVRYAPVADTQGDGPLRQSVHQKRQSRISIVARDTLLASNGLQASGDVEARRTSVTAKDAAEVLIKEELRK